MKNTHTKKLIACFFTALSLNANLTSVSATNFGQIGDNIRFFFRIFKGKKAEQKNNLDALANQIDDFLNNGEGNYYDICKQLFENLKLIKDYRDNNGYYSSIFWNSLQDKNIFSEDAINDYPSNDKDFNGMQAWIKKIARLHGGIFTVWGNKIRDALNNLSKIYNEHGHLVGGWLANDDIRCLLYNDGHLIIKGNGKIDKSLFDESVISFGDRVKRISDFDALAIGSFAKTHVIKRCIKSISFEGDTIEIEDCAFSDLEALTSVTIPKSVKNIGYFNFTSCRQLKCIKISKDSPIKKDIEERLLLPDDAKIEEF